MVNYTVLVLLGHLYVYHQSCHFHLNYYFYYFLLIILFSSSSQGPAGLNGGAETTSGGRGSQNRCCISC